MTLSRISMVFVVAAAMVIAPLAIAPAHAGPLDDARRHYQRGNELFQGGDYQGAIREFRAADKLAPAPLLSYNIALCFDRLGKAKEAIEHYRKYLDAVPNAPNRADIEDAIRRLSPGPSDPYASAGQGQGQAPPAEPPAEPGASAGAPAEPPAQPAAVPAPTYSGSDAGLRRVSAINIADVEARYRGGQASGPEGSAPGPEAGGPATGPDASAAGVATAPPPPPESEGDRGPAPAPQKHTPVYKKWWFWVVVGVGALVVINVIANSGDSSTDTPAVNGALLVDPSSSLPATAASGPALWRF